MNTSPPELEFSQYPSNSAAIVGQTNVKHANIASNLLEAPKHVLTN